ncbi:hypothetical protein C1645_831848 [Glomus cerebriforme]|uniref:Uncharacterized protein n=1 Tax=Glomus cerebriforme TaxID=658196 RepID=A0A397SPZ9_9GLOM|nr:hypothetical protein C1645_831848 [Glomus cerebriforme]
MDKTKSEKGQNGRNNLKEECTLSDEIKKLRNLYVQNDNNELIISNQESSTLYKSNSIDSINGNYTSKIYQFVNFPEPRNTTEEEQEAFHSKPYSFNIPDNINNFNNSSNENVSQSSNVYKVFEKLQINSDYNIQNDHERKTVRQFKKHEYIDVNDDIYNNPNFHSEEQDDLEIPR